MNTTLKAGTILGVLCVIWTFVMGFTGWYKDPNMLTAFWLVILIEIGVLVWGLRQTAAERTYVQQVVTGSTMALIGGAIIFIGSLLFTTVAFPNYFEELKGIQVQMLQQEGKSEQEIATVVAASAGMHTPLMNALSGFIGTAVTGVIASALIAIGVRKKA
jgi:hypothetical protein